MTSWNAPTEGRTTTTSGAGAATATGAGADEATAAPARGAGVCVRAMSSRREVAASSRLINVERLPTP
jgi:hypothetical protein